MIEFKFVHEVCIMKLNKQIKINSTDHHTEQTIILVYAMVHVHCAMPWAKKRPAKVLKKTIMLCPPKSYYSICVTYKLILSITIPS